MTIPLALPFHCICRWLYYVSYHLNIILDLTINFASTNNNYYDVGEEERFVTIELTISETQRPFTLTLTPTTVDDVLADTRISATDYLGESFSTLSESGKATPGGKICRRTIICHINIKVNVHLVSVVPKVLLIDTTTNFCFEFSII